MGRGPEMRSGGVCAPSATALTVTPIRRQFSCASLDAVVDYFVSHTNKALVPFLLDEDYEKVLGGCGLRELGGPSTCLSGSCPHGSPLGQCPASAPPLGPLSVLGHVEADKENGESVWVARSTPAAPGPGDAPALRPPLGQSGKRPGTHMAPPVSNLLQKTRKLPRPCPPDCGGGDRQLDTLLALCGGTWGWRQPCLDLGRERGQSRRKASCRRGCLLKVSKDFSR